jgi:hypothetical protein
LLIARAMICDFGGGVQAIIGAAWQGEQAHG